MSITICQWIRCVCKIHSLKIVYHPHTANASKQIIQQTGSLVFSVHVQSFRPFLISIKFYSSIWEFVINSSHPHIHWLQMNIVWRSLNLPTSKGTLANTNKEICRMFAFAVPSTYPQYRQINELVQCLFAMWTWLKRIRLKYKNLLPMECLGNWELTENYKY